MQGTEINVEYDGDGPAVIFLHAGIVDKRMWDPQFSWLKESHRVVRWNSRGYGDTPHVPGPFSYADDVAAVMDAFGLERATFVGCSQGGATALRIALAYPERVLRLALVSSWVHGYEPPASVEQLAIVQEIEDAAQAQDWDRLLPLQVKFWIAGLGREDSSLDPNFLSLCRDMLRSGFAPENGAQLTDEEAQDTERLEELTMPLLVVVGEEDDWTIRDIGRRIAQTAPQARFRSIPDAAHLPSLERADIFNVIFEDWLNAVQE